MGLVTRVLLVSIATVFHIITSLSQLNKIISASIETKGQYSCISLIWEPHYNVFLTQSRYIHVFNKTYWLGMAPCFKEIVWIKVWMAIWCIHSTQDINCMLIIISKNKDLYWGRTKDMWNWSYLLGMVSHLIWEYIVSTLCIAFEVPEVIFFL